MSSFKNDIVIDAGNSLKFLTSTLNGTRKDILLVKTNGDTVLNSSTSDLYINTTIGNNASFTTSNTYINSSTSNANLYILSYMGVGTTVANSHITLVTNSTINIDSTMGYLNIRGKYSNIKLFADDSTNAQQLWLKSGSSGSVKLGIDTAENIILNNDGSVQFQPNGTSTVRLYHTDSLTTLDTPLKISNNSLSVGNLLSVGSVARIGGDVFITGNTSTSNIYVANTLSIGNSFLKDNVGYLLIDNPTTTQNASVLSLVTSLTDTNFKLHVQKGVNTNTTNDILAKISLNYNNSQNNGSIRFHRGSGGGDGFLSFSSDEDTERMIVGQNVQIKTNLLISNGVSTLGATFISNGSLSICGGNLYVSNGSAFIKGDLSVANIQVQTNLSSANIISTNSTTSNLQFGVSPSVKYRNSTNSGDVVIVSGTLDDNTSSNTFSNLAVYANTGFAFNSGVNLGSSLAFISQWKGDSLDISRPLGKVGVYKETNNNNPITYMDFYLSTPDGGGNYNGLTKYARLNSTSFSTSCLSSSTSTISNLKIETGLSSAKLSSDSSTLGGLFISTGNLLISGGGLIHYGTSTLSSTLISNGSLSVCGGNVNISGGIYMIANSNVDYFGNFKTLNPGMDNSENFTFFNAGKLDSANNNVELRYYHIADGSSSNGLKLGCSNIDNHVFIRNDGNTGFGTTSPDEKIHVAGNGKITNNLSVGNILSSANIISNFSTLSSTLISTGNLTISNGGLFVGGTSTLSSTLISTGNLTISNGGLFAGGTSTLGSTLISNGSLSISTGNLNICGGSAFIYGDISTTNLQVQTNLSSANIRSNYLSVGNVLRVQGDIYTTNLYTVDLVSSGRLSVNETSTLGSTLISNGSLTISNGSLTISNGGLFASGTSTLGSTLISNGSLTICGGNLNISNGNLNITNGNINVSGYISVGNVHTSEKIKCKSAQITINGTVDGGNNHGLYWWDLGDSNWGSYFSQSGSLKSLANGTACDGKNFTSWAIRNRVSNSNSVGFIWENSSEDCLMSLKGDDGSLFVKGNSTMGSINLNTGIYGTTVGNSTIPLNSNFTDSYPIYAIGSTIGGSFTGTTSANIFSKGFTSLTDGNFKMKTNVISKFYFFYKLNYNIYA